MPRRHWRRSAAGVRGEREFIRAMAARGQHGRLTGVRGRCFSRGIDPGLQIFDAVDDTPAELR